MSKLQIFAKLVVATMVLFHMRNCHFVQVQQKERKPAGRTGYRSNTYFYDDIYEVETTQKSPSTASRASTTTAIPTNLTFCATRNDCALNEFCEKNQCRFGCEISDDCSLGHYCSKSTSRCVKGCLRDVHCPFDHSCKRGKCVKRISDQSEFLEELSCVEDSDCFAADFQCFDKKCLKVCQDDTDCLGQSDICNENGHCEVNVNKKEDEDVGIFDCSVDTRLPCLPVKADDELVPYPKCQNVISYGSSNNHPRCAISLSALETAGDFALCYPTSCQKRKSCCIIPFRHGGFFQRTCMRGMPLPLKFCATKVDNYGNLLEWGLCSNEIC